jgi:hypothetical protein
MKRSENKGYLNGGYRTISIITAKRSLDVEIEDDKIHSDLLQGLTLVRNYYQTHLKEELNRYQLAQEEMNQQQQQQPQHYHYLPQQQLPQQEQQQDNTHS